MRTDRKKSGRQNPKVEQKSENKRVKPNGALQKKVPKTEVKELTDLRLEDFLRRLLRIIPQERE
jgi:hypothetical protein